jgi:hypothetical protein
VQSQARSLEKILIKCYGEGNFQIQNKPQTTITNLKSFVICNLELGIYFVL